jgi:hypothetical protein
VKLKRIITFTKWPRRKFRNHNNDEQIRKHNTINLLKINKTFTKGLRKEIRNKKIKGKIGKNNI